MVKVTKGSMRERRTSTKKVDSVVALTKRYWWVRLMEVMLIVGKLVGAVRSET